MKDKILINGGKKLFGSVNIQGSKNAILPIIAGSILCNEKLKLNNVPNLLDVKNMLKIIKSLGGKVNRENDILQIDNSCIEHYEIDENLSKTLRSSIFILGPMLARFKQCTLHFPGGCSIGSRPIDLHIDGLRTLGAKIDEYEDKIVCDGKSMHSGKITLNFPSVGATENLMMSAVFLKGETKVFNPAKEPEIVDLQNFLNSIGCNISGAGTNEITIVGVNSTHTTNYTPIGDRIVAGTYLVGCAMCGGKISLKNVNPEHIKNELEKLSLAGCSLELCNDCVQLSSTGKLSSIKLIETGVYPNFPTDMQSQFMAMQTISKGTSVIIENIFENRFKIVKELVKMGANITVRDKVAIVSGVKSLEGTNVKSEDLRGGASLVLAGLKARGATIVSNIKYIKRGYENIVENLQQIGANIQYL